MKKNYLIFSALIATCILFSGCKKKHDTTPAPIPCTTLVSQEDIVVTGGSFPGTSKNVYKYNANKKLVKIEYTYSPGTTYGSFDTIIYNGSNQITNVKSYNVGNPTPTYTSIYYSTGSRIDSVNQVGNNGSPYNSTTIFTYTLGLPSAQSVRYDVGASNGGPQNISSIVFTNGNVTSANLGVSFGGAATITNETTAPNPYLGLNNKVDILLMFDANNATSVYSNAAPGSPLFTKAYTYLNGKVNTITDNDGNGGTRVNTITYTCL
ncbi:MAG TPA: hypothetical protein VNW99_05845 [Cytophagaceae bacterium]|jgi:hypothetical protein|nr:hypothetical protein [Cytophagaceae bacterium]